MKAYNGFDRNDTYKDVERLPVGGYVLAIIDAKEVTNEWGSTLAIAFDIAEGDYKDFYKRNFDSQTTEDKKWKGVYRLRVPKDDGSEQDAWTKRRFNTVIVNIEESNPGYTWDWDEKKLKGKKIGALFNNKEYDFNGRQGFFTNCHSLVPVEKIRSGNFEIPADTLLPTKIDNNGYPMGAKPVENGFMNIPDGIDEELPFN